MRCFCLPACATMLLLSACAVSGAAATKGVQILPMHGKLRIEINGQLFTEYCYSNVPRPYFYPILGPEQLAMTRHWPLEDGEGEEHDHPHHRSLWYAHSKVNGLDFWSETNGACKIVHQKFLRVESGQQEGVIVSSNNWVANDGTIVCSDVRAFIVHNEPENQRLFDFNVTLYAPAEKLVTFGDDKDGAMAIRVAETMRLQRHKKPADGHIVLSTGARDEKTWGRRADWCDYYGPVDGKIVGVAIFDNPANPRHPTWWHVRDYGLFAANPFGIHDFEKKPKGTGDFTIPAGGSVTFRYRFYLHEGDDEQAGVKQKYDEYAREPAR